MGMKELRARWNACQDQRREHADRFANRGRSLDLKRHRAMPRAAFEKGARR